MDKWKSLFFEEDGEEDIYHRDIVLDFIQGDTTYRDLVSECTQENKKKIDTWYKTMQRRGNYEDVKMALQDLLVRQLQKYHPNCMIEKISKYKRYYVS